MSLLIPELIEESYIANKFFTEFSGVSVFIDICGYTNLTNILIQFSKEGIELLSALTNQIFTPIIDFIRDENGVIASFEGDSVLAIFPGVEKCKKIQLRENIRKVFDFNYQKLSMLINSSSLKNKLRNMDINIQVTSGSGIIKSRIITAKELSTYYFYGNAISECLLMHQDLDNKEILETSNLSFLKTENTPVKLNDFSLSKAKNSVSSKFISDDVFILPENFKGEIREVISCFIKLVDFPTFKDEDLPLLDELIAESITIINNYGGYFNRLTYSSKGLFLLALFGAPFYREHSVVRAADCINEVVYKGEKFARLKNIKLNLSAGISYGKAYCGFVGSQERAEYTALGGNVNLAARMMSRAKNNEIMINERFKEYTIGMYDTEYISRYKIKGFKDLQRVYRLNPKIPDSGLIPKEHTTLGKTKFYGRFTELENLKDTLKRFILSKVHYKHGLKFFTKIVGTPGIGKTRLVHESLIEFEEFRIFNFNDFVKFAQSGKSEKVGFVEFFIRANESSEENFLLLLSQIYEFLTAKRFNQSFKKGMNDLKVNITEIEEKYNSLSKRFSIFIKSVIQILDFVKDENFEISSESVNILIIDFFKSLSAIIPIIINIDNLQWLNRRTEKVLAETFLIKSSGKLFLLATERYDLTKDSDRFSSIDSFRDDLSSYQRIVLKPIKSSIVKQVIQGYLKKIHYKSISSENVKQIVRFCNGNPLFIEQILNYLGNNRQNVEFSEILSDSNLTSDLTDISKVPQGFKNILLSRFDRLNGSQKMILKTASVIGYSFGLESVADVMSVSVKSLEYQIYDLINFNFLSKKGHVISFRHDLLRDLVYNMQMNTEVKAIHAKIAKYYHNNQSDHTLESLAYHQFKSGNSKAVLTTWHKIAWKAFKNDEFKKARSYFEKILETNYPSKKHAISWTRIQINVHVAIVLHQIDKPEESNKILNEEKIKLQILLKKCKKKKRYKKNILKLISIILDKLGSNFRFIEDDPACSLKYYIASLYLREKYKLSGFLIATSLNFQIYNDYHGLLNEDKVKEYFYRINNLASTLSLKHLLLRVDSIVNILDYYRNLKNYNACLYYIKFAEDNILAKFKYTELFHHEVYYYYEIKSYILKDLGRLQDAFNELNKCIKISENIYGRFGYDTLHKYNLKVDYLSQLNKLESAYSLLNYCVDFLKISSKENLNQLLDFYLKALYLYYVNDDFAGLHEVLLDARKYHSNFPELDPFSFNIDLYQAYASFNTGQIFEAYILMEDIEDNLNKLLKKKIDVLSSLYNFELYIIICKNHYNLKNVFYFYKKFIDLKRNNLLRRYDKKTVEKSLSFEQSEELHLRIISSKFDSLTKIGKNIFNLIQKSVKESYEGYDYLFLNLGRIYFVQEHYSNAHRFFQNVVSMEGVKKDFLIQAKCYLAIIEFIKKRDLSVVERILENKVKYRFNQALIYETAAIIYLLYNDHQSADQYFKKAYNIKKKIVSADNYRFCEVVLMMGLNYIYLNNYRKASKVLIETLPFFYENSKTHIYLVVFKIIQLLIKNKNNPSANIVKNDLRKIQSILNKLKIDKNHNIYNIINSIKKNKKLQKNNKFFIFL